jgi:HSP20 family protein
MEVVRNEVPQTQAPEKAPQRTPSAQRVRAFSPPVDIFETQDAITVQIDVPGVNKDDVALRLEKNELDVVAARREALHGPIEYRRTFTIPQDVDGEAIVADLAKGVLTLTLPRKASAKPRTIQIR